MEIQKMLCHKAVGRVRRFESHEIQGHAIYNGPHCSASMSIVPGRKTLEVIDLFDASLGGSEDKESACNAQRTQFFPWAGKISWRREWLPKPVFLPEESHGQRSLAG